jgi:DNA-binding NtrC family response regulator
MDKKTIKKTEKMLILQALETTNGNKRKAAQFLCMPRSTFYNKLKEYGIDL